MSEMDSRGLIVGKNEDPGDSVQRSFMRSFIIGLSGSKKTRFLELCLVSYREDKFPWRYMRHPSPGWWSDLDRGSRDQLTSVLCALSIYGYWQDILKMLWPHILRLGFFYNTRRNGSTRDNHGEVYRSDGTVRNYNWKLPDIAGFEFLGLYVRGLRLYPLYPLLILSDVETLISSIIWRYFRKDETDILNYLIVTRFLKYKSALVWPLIDGIEDKERIKMRLQVYGKRVGLDLVKWWGQYI